jgi:hypothetical protein
VLGYFADQFAGFGLTRDRPEGHIDDLIFAIRAGPVLFFTRVSTCCNDMLAVF